MKIKHPKIAIALSFLLVVTAAKAFVPVAFLLAGLNLHLAAGMALDYMMRDVKPSSSAQPVRVYIKLNNAAPDNDAALEGPTGGSYSGPPSTKSPTYTGGGTISYTMGSWNTSGPVSYPGGTVTASSPAEFVTKMRSLAEPPFKYGGNAPSQWSPANASWITKNNCLASFTLNLPLHFTPCHALLRGCARLGADPHGTAEAAHVAALC